jgi:hypothetical protein
LKEFTYFERKAARRIKSVRVVGSFGHRGEQASALLFVAVKLAPPVG